MTAALLQTMGGINGNQVQANFNGIVLDASNDGAAFGFQAINTEAITHLGFRIGDRAGTPPTYRIALESLDGSGLPDGTVLGGGSPASATFTPPADSTWNSTWRWITLDNSYTPTRGQFLCMTIRHSTGTVDGSNNQTIFTSTSLRKVRRGWPSVIHLTAGTWAKVLMAAAFGYKTASGVYGTVGTNVTAGSAASTSGHRRAMKFTLPAGHGDTFQLAGCCFEFQTPAAAGTTKIGLWNAAGTELSSVTFDSDHFATNSTDCQVEAYFTDSTLPTLSYGTTYYIGVECLSSVSVNSRGVSLTEAGNLASFPNGANVGYSSWNGSTWSDDTTMFMPIQLIFADITEPAGGVGGGRQGLHAVEAGAV